MSPVSEHLLFGEQISSQTPVRGERWQGMMMKLVSVFYQRRIEREKFDSEGGESGCVGGCVCVCVIVRLAFRMWCHTGWPTSARQKEQNIWLWRANGRSPRLGGGWTNPIKERDEMYRQTVLYNWALSAIWLSFYMSHCKMVLIKSWEYNLNIGTDQIVWWIPSGHRLCDLKRKDKRMQICNTGSHADWLACTCGLYTVRNNGTIKIHLCP